MIFKSDYDRIIRENFDLNDNTTRKYIVSLEDAGQEQLIAALSSALYDKIVSKVTDIDFGTIPMSRGDITKVQGFANTEDCLDIIRKLVLEYKQDTSIVDIVISAINNVKDRKGVFMKGYALNVELPMVIYNTVVLAIERSVSLLIATCIQYVKDPQTMTTKMALDKVAYNNTMDDLLFKQLINFNNMCNNKSLDKILNELLANPPKAAALKRKGVKEDVDTECGDTCGVMVPVNDDESPFADTNGSDFTPDEDQNDSESPFTPGSTIEPGAENEEDDYDYDDATTDELLARLDDGPAEDAPEDDVPPADDAVEPDNIPVVVPGDSVSPDDQPITEYEGNEGDTNDETESDQKNLPVPPDEEVPVEEGLIGGIAAGLAVGSAALVLLPGLGKAMGQGIYQIANLIISFLRVIVYGVFYTSFKFSDYLAVQADLIEANANDLQYSTNTNLSDAERDKVVKKQRKTAQKLRTWSNKFNLDSKQVNNKVNKEIEKDAKNKYTIDPTNTAYDDGLF